VTQKPDYSKVPWAYKDLIGAITVCYNNIGNLLPSGDTTILVKI